jgi:hypothetical protein
VRLGGTHDRSTHAREMKMRREPMSLDTGVKQGPLKIREYGVLMLDGGLRIETLSFKADVYAYGGAYAPISRSGFNALDSRAAAAMRALRGANDLAAALTVDSPLDTVLQASKVCP